MRKMKRIGRKIKRNGWQSLEKFEGRNVLVAKPYVVLAPN